MYSKFNYSPSDYFYNNEINSYLTHGNEIYSKYEKEVQECLSEYISEEGVINGTALKEHWFSITPKNVFISHSPFDLNKVKAFAGWLHQCFGLEAFIDSCSWGYCDDLLNKIDNKYCYNPKTKTYNYTLRNYTTSHVHMMLSTALTEMMDQTECVIFFNTPSSICLEEELNKIKAPGKKPLTVSPWIYYELSMTTMLRATPPNREERALEHFAHDFRDSVTIQYDVSKELSEMAMLTDSQLRQWRDNWQKCHRTNSARALDELYKIVFSKR